MNDQLLASLAIISPAVFIVVAIASWFQPGNKPTLIKKLSMGASIVTLLIAGISSFSVFNQGLLETPFFGLNEIGFSLRLDSISVLMFSMISLLSFIVIRFSLNYLDGDAKQGAFIGRLSATIASVQLLVLSGNLGLLFISWVLTSMSLHRLLIFYKERPGARIAARKKFIMARLGDASLLAAVVLLYSQFGTGNLEVIFQTLKNSIATGEAIQGIEFAAFFIASAALLKSAQFPTHGWLIEVMETPTPVSALLHAGLLNAGPFLIIRMAFVMEASTFAPLILIAVGAFTALFASVVFLTQTSVKTALAYSSIAHMGFSLLVCGLGVYPAAMLHLVAHSFYKAHAFLSSGSVIDTIRSYKVTSAKRIGSPFRIAIGIALALGIYLSFALIVGIDPLKEMALLAIGGIIVMGLSRLFTSAIDSNGSIKLFFRALLMSIAVAAAFFILEGGTHFLLSNQIPELTIPSLTEMLFIIVILITFGAVVFIQIAAPVLKASARYQALAIHLRNGLYVNTVFDRTVRALYQHNPQTRPEIEESADYIRREDPIELKRLSEQTA